MLREEEHPISSNLTVRPVAATQAGEPHAVPAPAEKVTTAPVTERAAATTPAHPNPTLRLDSALGLVVIEFRDESGAVTHSIPSAHQLEAYRRTLAKVAPLDVV